MTVSNMWTSHSPADDSLAIAARLCNNDCGSAVHLENDIAPLPSVQATRTTKTQNGCTVTMLFPEKGNPNIRREVAGLLISAFEYRRENHEESSMLVQSIN